PDGVAYTPRPGSPLLTEAFRTGTIPTLPAKIGDLIRNGSPHPTAGERAAREYHRFAANSSGPVDVEAEAAAMRYKGDNGTGSTAILIRVIPSLLRRGEHPNDVLERIVGAVLDVGPKEWRQVEEHAAEIKETRSRILSGYNNLLLRSFDPATGQIPDWLPGDIHEQ